MSERAVSLAALAGGPNAQLLTIKKLVANKSARGERRSANPCVTEFSCSSKLPARAPRQFRYTARR